MGIIINMKTRQVFECETVSLTPKKCVAYRVRVDGDAVSGKLFVLAVSYDEAVRITKRVSGEIKAGNIQKGEIA